MSQQKLDKKFTKLHEQLLNCYNELNPVHLLTSTFFAGGAIVRHYAGDKAKDYDMFYTATDGLVELSNLFLSGIGLHIVFTVDEVNPKLMRGVLTSKTETPVDELISKLNAKWSSNRDSNKKQGLPIYLSRNAITFNNGLQIIFRFIGEPEEIFSTFDYEHCKCYWRPDPFGVGLLGKLTFCGRSLESIAKKELIYSGNSRFILSAMYRALKFANRGYKLTPATMIQLSRSAALINWESPAAISEEIAGIYDIDYKYAMKLVEASTTNGRVDIDNFINLLGK